VYLKSLRVCIFAFLFLPAQNPPGLNGIEFTAELKKDNSLSFQAWHSGDNLKFRITASRDQDYPVGTILLSRNNGQTVYLILPSAKAYTSFTRDDAVARTKKQAKLQRLTVQLKGINTELEEEGGVLFDYPSRHSKIRYTMVQGRGPENGGQVYSVTVVEDRWTLPQLPRQIATPDELTADDLLGVEPFDSDVDAHLSKIKGFIVRRDILATYKSEDGNTKVMRSSFQVRELVVGPLSGVTFELPTGLNKIGGVARP
jgi:hypothetical protein